MSAPIDDPGSTTASRSPGRTLWIAAVGAAAGFLSGLFGVGGGILLVPGLVLVVGMEQRRAHGTSLAAVLPISAAGLVTYWVHDNVDWPVAALLALGAVGGAVLGTRLLTVLPYRTLAISFAVLLVASAVRLFIPLTSDGRSQLTVPLALGMVAVGLASGILAGLLGVGGGVVMVPAMVVLVGLTPVVAKGTSLAVIIPTAAMGTWRNRAGSNVDLRAAAVLGAGGVLFALLGAKLADSLSDTVSNVLFASLMLIVAARLLWQLAGHDSSDETSTAEGVTG